MASDSETSTANPSANNDMEFWTERKLRFRILIIGRANAGKTTILEQLTDSSEGEAEIYRRGSLLKAKAVKGQIERGLHNVEDEIIFPGRPGFVFHDSRGFEAGSTGELGDARKFIKDAVEATDLKKQIHAIWMCLPLDEARDLYDAERDVFGWERGEIPLIVIFTKRDGAVTKVMSEIPSEDRAAKRNARKTADADVDDMIQRREEALTRLANGSSVRFVTVGGLDERRADTTAACETLITVTNDMLTSETLKALLWMVWGRNAHRTGQAMLARMIRASETTILWNGKYANKRIIHRYMHTVSRWHPHPLDYPYPHHPHHLHPYYLPLPHLPHLLPHHLFLSPDQDEKLYAAVSALIGSTTNQIVSTLLSFLVTLIGVHSITKKIHSSQHPTHDVWFTSIMHVLSGQKESIRPLVPNIRAGVEQIVHEVEHRDLLTQLNPTLAGKWKLSEAEIEYFTKKLVKLAEDNIVVYDESA